eukprot:UN14599
MNLIRFPRFFLCRNILQNEFQSKKRRFLHILLNNRSMYFLKAKFESFSFEKMKFKNKLPLTAYMNHTLVR